MNAEVIQGDLLDQKADAIVNAWNRNIIPWWLLLPQGVSGAIKRRAGLEPFRQVGRHGPIPLGDAVLDEQHLAVAMRMPVGPPAGLEEHLVHGNTGSILEHGVLVHATGKRLLPAPTRALFDPSVADLHPDYDTCRRGGAGARPRTAESVRHS